jgi:hypothetical protein
LCQKKNNNHRVQSTDGERAQSTTTANPETIAEHLSPPQNPDNTTTAKLQILRNKKIKSVIKPINFYLFD